MVVPIKEEILRTAERRRDIGLREDIADYALCRRRISNGRFPPNTKRNTKPAVSQPITTINQHATAAPTKSVPSPNPLYSPQTPFVDGLRQTVAWYLQQGVV
jgi:hypothetical protein